MLTMGKWASGFNDIFAGKDPATITWPELQLLNIRICKDYARPLLLSPIAQNNKGQQPQISRRRGFPSYWSCAAVRKTAAGWQNSRGRIHPDPLLPHGRFWGCEMLFCSFSSSFAFLAGEFVPCHCTEILQVFAVLLIIPIENQLHKVTAAHAWGSSGSQLWLSVKKVETGKHIWQEGE